MFHILFAFWRQPFGKLSFQRRQHEGTRSWRDHGRRHQRQFGHATCGAMGGDKGQRQGAAHRVADDVDAVGMTLEAERQNKVSQERSQAIHAQCLRNRREIDRIVSI